ncbi:DUF418 domain-containing protein [Microbacterium lushaniae]|nr:DUF418 domain-containing protein [Microbacterium lushaniae]KAA9152370.1 DUF418 domain-containing protein [Microbacterium lushaniae]
MVNYILIAEFDVLMGYAVTGAAVAWLLMTRPRTQRVMIAVFGALHLVLITGIVALVALNPSSGSLPPGPSPYATDSFLGLAAFRLEKVVLFRAEPVLIGFLTLAMFLIGARLLRAGIFAAEGGRLRRRLMFLGAVEFPVDFALGVAGGPAGLLAERYLVAPLVALGLLAFIAELRLRRGTQGWVAQRTRDVGRVALSAYMLQNLLGGALFYGWGLALAPDSAGTIAPLTVSDRRVPPPRCLLRGGRHPHPADRAPSPAGEGSAPRRRGRTHHRCARASPCA